ncbi:chy zinc finger protein [Rutstroemia sp. NJR-2017a BBW]|nr:chy zinc finger protein [Rutstroemia sp. NJR-2017a BBW]
MTSLVSEFIINPVLRQARRFSRSNTPTDLHESNVRATPQLVADDEVDEVAIEYVIEEDIATESPSLSHRGMTDRDSTDPAASLPIPGHNGKEVEMRGTGELDSDDLQSAAHLLEPSHGGAPELQSRPSSSDGFAGDYPSNMPFQHDETSAGILTESSNDGGNESLTRSAETVDEQITQASTSLFSGLEHNAGILPEDDGMGLLRERILCIQSMDVPTERKAQLMHQLMTQNYTKANEMFQVKHDAPIIDPAQLISQERPSTPGTLSSFLWQMNGSPDQAPSNDHYTFHLSPDDLKRTYAPPDPPEGDDPSDESESAREIIPVLGCKHYKRNVKLQCSTCDRWYTCRLCHDEVEDHVLIRHETKNMLCMLCGCAQKAGEFCVECGERTAWYYCGVCKLWDNDSNKSIYHCSDCGICRKGRGLGKDFFHCKTCGVCMSMSVMHDHKCIERVSDCDCPICGEYMFTSPKPVVFMSCGHSIHSACYVEHMHTSYKCPICSKSLITMETQFRNLDRAIENQPMPPQFRNTLAMVSCNDCYAKSAVKYHWLGLKCAICDSYNTAQLSILQDPASEEEEGIETEDGDNPTMSTQEPRDMISSTHLIPGSSRNRRHSSHIPTSSSQGESSLAPDYSLISRLGRSVSPARGMGLFANEADSRDDSDASGDEDDLDFWGRDEPRSTQMPQNRTEGQTGSMRMDWSGALDILAGYG